MIVRQRRASDCGVAALAMAAEVAYEDAYVAVSLVEKKRRGGNGLHNCDVIKAATHLGLTLVATRSFDLDIDEGVLRLRWNKKPKTDGGHFVCVKNGLVLDPSDGVAVAWADYLERYSARTCSLLKEVG